MTKPILFSQEHHKIERHLIDPDALRVVERLQSKGYLAYLVGGSVRDLLIKNSPKDFDISTSAKPEEIKSLFGRQCLLIGRRFRLAHVRVGKKVFEVSTFRAGDPDDDGLIVRDNLWGTEGEDVLRRDFTINGLYYDPARNVVIDYVGGIEDLKKGILVTIGEPEKRFRQDPVRMIRLLKFRARLRLEIDSQAKIALLRCRRDILKSSPARLLEEILKMIESGYSAPFFQLLEESKLLELIFPKLAPLFASEQANSIFNFLVSMDMRLQQGIDLSRALLLSGLFYPIVKEIIQKKGQDLHLGEIHSIAYDNLHDCLVGGFHHFPKKLLSDTSMILTDQWRLCPLNPKKRLSFRYIRHPNFKEAFHLFSIRLDHEPSNLPLYEEWCKHLEKNI